MATGVQARRLGLEVRSDVRPIEGRIFDDGGDGGLDLTFCGWLGLMAAIDAALADDTPQPRASEEEAR
jgi:hypothetical protein